MRRLPQVTAMVAAALVVGACSGSGSAREDRSDPGAARTTSSVTSADAGPLARFYGQRLSWSDCRGGFECARLTVPVDYERPRGRTIRLALVRLPASGEARGSLVLNPGGPGGSGVDYARAAHSVVSGAVRERFDVVGFDPRGVQRSAPIECLGDRALDRFLAVDGSPDDVAEEQTLARVSRELGAGCVARRPALTPRVSTRDVARDLDVLRAALGDRRLTYLGKSYGTFLGATYAEQFPRRVGRLVLDGQLDPALTSAEIAAGQADGFHRAFRAYLGWCLRRTCPFTGSVDAAQEQVAGLLDRVDARPLPGEARRPVTQSLLVLGIAAALYDEGSWPILSRAFREAVRGTGSTFLALADFYSDRGPGGRYTTNAIEAQYAVNCLDRPEATTLDDFRAEAASVATSSPVFGPFIAWSGLPCATWPVPPVGTPHPVVAAGARPILVVGTTRDPATPYRWSVSTARSLESGRLLTYVGDGHTAYRRGSACVDRAVDRYLLTGELPARGTRCR